MQKSRHPGKGIGPGRSTEQENHHAGSGKAIYLECAFGVRVALGIARE
jgi:hypothetical protein